VGEGIDSARSNALELFRKCLPTFRALGDTTRQDIIMLLGQHPRLNVGHIAAQSKLSRPAISHHLRILKETGLVRIVREGTENYYVLNASSVLGELKALIEAVEASSHSVPGE
jgi:DNA-binding transcriptional ArsR family regulator